MIALALIFFGASLALFLLVLIFDTAPREQRKPCEVVEFPSGRRRTDIRV